MGEELLKDKLDRLETLLTEMNDKKRKKFRIPMKAKVRKSKLKRGYISIAMIHSNKNIDFLKLPILDGTFKLDDTVHAVEEQDIFTYKGRPFIFQAKDKINPYNPLHGDSQTYGQKYIMARMKSDVIKANKKAINGMLIFGLIIAGIIAIYFFTGGSL